MIGVSRRVGIHHLHLSTYVVLLLATANFIVLMVPGQLMVSVAGWGNDFNKFEHGWPWRYLTRSTYPASGEFLPIGSIPWLHRQCWSMRGREVKFDSLLLAADIACIVAVLTALGWSYERWRRRRRRLCQFNVKQLAAAVACCGLALTWWTGWQRRHREVTRNADALNKQHVSVTFGYVGPIWLGRLTGGPEAFWEPDHLMIFGEDGCNLVVQKMRASDKICLSHVEDVDITTTSLPETTVESLAELPSLKSIRFPMCPAMGDRECEELSRIGGLRELYLCGTAVSDAGLAKLRPLRKLRKLDVRSTKITPAAVARLQQARPRLEVVADWTPEGDAN